MSWLWQIIPLSSPLLLKDARVLEEDLFLGFLSYSFKKIQGLLASWRIPEALNENLAEQEF